MITHMMKQSLDIIKNGWYMLNMYYLSYTGAVVVVLESIRESLGIKSTLGVSVVSLGPICNVLCTHNGQCFVYPTAINGSIHLLQLKCNAVTTTG